jgi:MerR family transcriptional regulator, redox-sensitive transcriptional activator SoxR
MTEVPLTIGEMAERTGVAPSALRFYESEGLIFSTRSSGGQRRYLRSTLRRVAFIRVAQRVGLTLEEIRDAMAKLPSSRTPTKSDWARVSASWRPRLDDQIAVLERLRDELTSCIGCGCLSLRSCRLYNPNDAAAGIGPGPRYLLGDERPDRGNEPTDLGDERPDLDNLGDHTPRPVP